MLSGHLRNVPGGNRRTVRERLIILPYQLRQDLDRVRSHAKFLMVGSKVLGHCTGIVGLVVFFLIKTNTECFDRLVRDLLHQRNHKRRIDTA